MVEPVRELAVVFRTVRPDEEDQHPTNRGPECKIGPQPGSNLIFDYFYMSRVKNLQNRRSPVQSRCPSNF